MKTRFPVPAPDNAGKNTSPAPTDLERIVDVAISRRQFLGGMITFGTGAFLSAIAPWVQATEGTSSAISGRRLVGNQLKFEAVGANTDNTITLPRGFSHHRLISWGDPLWSDMPPFDHKTRGTAASQARAMGDNNDGMEIFEKNGHVLLAVNNEYVNLDVMYAGGRPKDKDDVHKAMAAVGVTIIEIKQRHGKWRIVKDSRFNRRITADTPSEITGPAAGHELLRTSADPAGRSALGTFANCGSGKTPWGTYLSCEENFDYAFRSGTGREQTDRMRRYGIGRSIAKEQYAYGAWEAADERFEVDKEPQEANRFGYVVELDPADPSVKPKKRTALGRFKHENAEIALAGDGRVVVYMGDDERGEYLYKFISSEKYMTSGRDVLDEGRLFAAKFHTNGRGEWLPLTPQTTGMIQAEICIFTRQAASMVKATTMDRPEWVAAHPHKTEVYCALTNNKDRGKKPNKGGDDTPVGGPNPRRQNKYGQIVQWMPDGGDHAAAGFRWKLFVLAGNPTVHQDDKAGSDNINEDNMFNSPDGLAFDDNGGLWIQTDGEDSDTGDFAGQGNNQMLLGDTESGEIRRFLVGPKGAEITGLCWSPDKKTMFVGIQHPRENFPDSGSGTLPRSSIIAVQRDDDGRIG